MLIIIVIEEAFQTIPYIFTSADAQGKQLLLLRLFQLGLVSE